MEKDISSEPRYYGNHSLYDMWFMPSNTLLKNDHLNLFVHPSFNMLISNTVIREWDSNVDST